MPPDLSTVSFSFGGFFFPCSVWLVGAGSKGGEDRELFRICFDCFGFFPH